MNYLDELWGQLLLLSAAGLGALFALLYPLTRSVARGTYDPNEDTTYLVKVVVGLVSGTILSQLIDVSNIGGLGDLTKPTLALIGGFAASLVYKILTSVVQGSESMLSGDVGSPPAPSTALELEMKYATEKHQLLRQLASLHTELNTGSPEADKLDEIIQAVLETKLA